MQRFENNARFRNREETPLNRFKRLIRGQRGQDTVEYGLLAACLSIATVGALLYIGPSVKPVYYRIQDAVRRAATAHYPQGTGGDNKGNETPTE